MDVKMYIVVNKNLNMSSGKIGSQCSHSSCMVVDTIYEDKNINVETIKNYKLWKNGSYTKIVLQANEQDMKNLISEYSNKTSKIWCEYVIDEGRTEIEQGSLTTIAFCPMTKNDIPAKIKRLRLL
jgi:peptidyl-tRNA hydrolase, PTH2 family